MSEYLTIRNWKRFQHYKDRNPPWIKLHYELLTSPDWVMVSDASKLLAVVCMMLASRKEGQVLCDPSYIQKVANLSTKPCFKQLISIGFFDDASNMLADASTKTETEAKSEAKSENKKGSRFALQSIPNDWIAYCRQERPDLNPESVFNDFRDYWISVAGVKGVKLDWFATWRTWVRKQHTPSWNKNTSPLNSQDSIYRNVKI